MTPMSQVLVSGGQQLCASTQEARWTVSNVLRPQNILASVSGGGDVITKCGRNGVQSINFFFFYRGCCKDNLCLSRVLLPCKC